MGSALPLPIPDVIPAPAWLFHVLETALFTVHILLINVILGGSILLFFASLRRRAEAPSPLFSALATKLPVSFALAINMGVAPLLFLQVTYGHLFYASSVLLGVFWILIIPFVIVAYYGAYIHARSPRPLLAAAALGLTVLVLLYAGFVHVNNMSMMMQPAQWSAYFGSRIGNVLPSGDPALIPRYLHYVTASIAIAGLFSSLVWSSRQKRGVPESGKHVQHGLFIFLVATIFQIVVGLVFLGLLPRGFIFDFLGRNLFATVLLSLGLLLALGAMVTVFLGKVRATLVMALLTVVVMVLIRDHVRTLYLANTFDPSTLRVDPQYGVLALFLVVLLLGLASVAWMLRAGFKVQPGRAAQ